MKPRPLHLAPRALALLLFAASSAGGDEVPFGPAVVIDTLIAYPSLNVGAADLDGDGDPDVFAGGPFVLGEDFIALGGVAWYENTDGAGDFGAPQTVDDIGANGTEFDQSLFAADLDGDGDLDLVASDRWFENASGDASSWVKHAVDTGIAVWAVDLDGDEDLDLLSGDGADVAWLESDGGSPPAFTTRSIGTLDGQVLDVTAADLDGDGDLDVLALNATLYPFEDHPVLVWYESGGGAIPAWTARTIDLVGACISAAGTTVRAVDLDGDDDLDVMGSCVRPDGLGQTVWYESDGGTLPSFTRRVVSNDSPSTALARVDGDADVDILGGAGGLAVWFDNDGGSPPDFSARLVGDIERPTLTGVAAADLDGDGDRDILATGNDFSPPVFDGAVVWFENQSPPLVPALPGLGLLVLGAALLVTPLRARPRASGRVRVFPFFYRRPPLNRRSHARGQGRRGRLRSLDRR